MKVKYLLSVQREGTSNEDLWDENLKKSLIVGRGGGGVTKSKCYQIILHIQWGVMIKK